MNSSENCRRGRRPLLLLGIRDIVSTFRKMSTKPDQAQAAQTELVNELNLVLGRVDFYSSGDVVRIVPGRFTAEINGLIRRKTGPLTARRLNKLLFRNHFEQFLRH